MARDTQQLDITTHSAAETRDLGTRLAQWLQPGDIIALVGDLGAGKTTFVQGIGRGLGVSETISSPTFTLIGEYDGRCHLYHIDVYRLLDAPAEALAVGLDEILGGDGITVIEWADTLTTVLPPDVLWITLRLIGDHTRQITLRAAGSRAQAMLQALSRVPQP